jgi:hypothetical protein
MALVPQNIFQIKQDVRCNHATFTGVVCCTNFISKNSIWQIIE